MADLRFQIPRESVKTYSILIRYAIQLGKGLVAMAVQIRLTSTRILSPQLLRNMLVSADLIA
ncbi:MAG: hypothetical protein HY695_37510 [Deltaproteobacteria bacterium]|nr:hypothetical protein [Deltaproteobacteria bacterium]